MEPQPMITPVPPVSPVYPISKSKNQAVVWIVTGAVILAIGIGVGLILGKYLPKPKQITSYEECVKANGNQITLIFPGTCTTRDGRQFTQPLTEEEKKKLLPPDPTANWKTYTDPQNQYSVKYPPETSLSNYREGSYSGIHLLLIGPAQIASGRIQTSLSDGVSIKILVITNISTPLRDYAEQRRVADSQSAPKDDPQPTVGKLSEVLVGGKSGYRYTVDDRGSIAQVNFVSLNNNILHIVTRSAGSPGNQQQYTNLINQILSTFKLLEKRRPENIVCGTIAGNLPEHKCPEGYTCQLEGNYPDAAGKCVKPQVGLLNATVMRSPTCAGGQRPGETCEAPVANETFNITKLSDNNIIQSVHTDKDGKFIVSLASGSYKLQNSTGGTDKFGRIGGIGKYIGNPDFIITSGKTTTQRFDIDTGIQ